MLALWTERTGAQLLQGVADGDIPPPPYYDHLGLRVEGAEPGVASMVWEPTSVVGSPDRQVHGGYVAMVLDETCCCAGSSHGERAYPMITLSLSIDYLRPIAPGHRYAVRGEVVHPGKRRVVVNGAIRDPGSRLLAQATAALVPDLSFADRVDQLNAPGGEQGAAEQPQVLPKEGS